MAEARTIMSAWPTLIRRTHTLRRLNPTIRSIVRQQSTLNTEVPIDPVVDLPPGVSSDPSQSNRLTAIRDSKPFSSFLTDTFNRQHDYLRISITEKCNLRCVYCMPEEGVPLTPKKHLLTPQEIQYISSLFVSQGVTKIRLTGGEPTIHPQIMSIIRDLGSLRQNGLREIALTTNGITLPRKLEAMVESGVTGINLSLDTLDPFQFEIMTRRKGFDQVMKSIDKILSLRRSGAPLKLKVNAVVIRGLNDHQILPFVDLTRDKDLEVRFIEYMPFDGNRWSSAKMLPYQEMLSTIRAAHPTVRKILDHPNDTSKTFAVPGYAGRIGFITSMTEHFCGSCNRLRITSDGNLKVCLFGNAEVSLRDLLRANFNNGQPIDEAAWAALKQLESDRHALGAPDHTGLRDKEAQLLDVIGAAVRRKKAKHAGIGQLEHMKNRPMILIGG